MTASTGVLVAVGSAGFEPLVLEAAAGPGVHVVRRCVDVADLVATAASRQARVAVVSVELGGLDAEVVDRLNAEEVVVVGVTASSVSADEALLRRLGIGWIAAADDLVSLAEMLVEAARDPAPSTPGVADAGAAVPGATDPEARRGRVIAVWGPTGAPGRSVVAVNLAAELARLDAPTLLVDATSTVGRSRRCWASWTTRPGCSRRLERPTPGRSTHVSWLATLVRSTAACGCSPASRGPTAGQRSSRCCCARY